MRRTTTFLLLAALELEAGCAAATPGVGEGSTDADDDVDDDDHDPSAPATSSDGDGGDETGSSSGDGDGSDDGDGSGTSGDTPAVCGNAVRDPGEGCDLEDLGGQGCDSTCQPTASGTASWVASEPGLASDVAVGGDDEIYVVGHTGVDDDIWLAKLDHGGALAWEVRWSGLQGNADRAHGVDLDSEGNVVVIGQTDQLEGGEENQVDPWVWVGKYSPAGDELWVEYWDSPAHAHTNGAVAPDDAIVVIDGGYASDGTLTKLDPEGTLLWDMPVPLRSQCAVAVDVDGSIVVTGQDEGADAIWVGKYDADGVALWDVTYAASDAVAISAGNDIAFDGSSNVVIGGQIASQVSSVDAWLSKLDPDGNKLWTTTVGLAEVQLIESIAVDSHDRIVVAGPVPGYGHAMVGRFDADGQLEWTWVDSDRSEYEGVLAVAVDDEDRPVSAGFISTLFTLDAVVVLHGQ